MPGVWPCTETTKFENFFVKEHCLVSGKVIYKTGENISKSCIWQRYTIEKIQRTLTTQQ